MPELTFKSLRALHWNDLYIPLHEYLVTGKLPEKTASSLTRFKRVAKHFELDPSTQDIILITNIIPPELLDSDGEPLVELDLPLKFTVIDPRRKKDTIITCFNSVQSGGFKGVESLYRKISSQYLGISRNDIADVLKKMELKQLKRPTLTREIKPILTTRPMEYWQIDLVDFTKLGYEKFNDNYVFILNIVDIFSKFVWSFPLKNKSGAVVAYTLQKLILTEGSPSIIGSDNGTEFSNPEMDSLALAYSIEFRHGQPYKSNTQGGIERVNGTLRDSIFNYLQSALTKRWIDKLPFFAYSYNTAFHSSSKVTPFMAHRRRHEVFKIDKLVSANIEKVAQNMIKRNAQGFQPKKIKKVQDLELISVGDDVRVSTQSQIEVRAQGEIKVKSKLKKGLLAGYSRETYKVTGIINKEDGTILYKLSGDHKRNYYLRNELQKVELKGLIKVGDKNLKEDLSFGESGFDLEQHLVGLSSSSSSKASKEFNMDQDELEDKYKTIIQNTPDEFKHGAQEEIDIVDPRSVVQSGVKTRTRAGNRKEVDPGFFITKKNTPKKKKKKK